MDDTNEIIDDEDRVCEWAGCNQHYVGLEALVQHVNSVHVQVKIRQLYLSRTIMVESLYDNTI